MEHQRHQQVGLQLEYNQQGQIMPRGLFPAGLYASCAALQARAVLQRDLLVCHCREPSTTILSLSLAACLLAHCKHAVPPDNF